MPTIDLALVLTEAFAACALLANIIAYKQAGLRAYRMYSGLAMLLLAIHFFRLEAYAASVGCSLAVIRNVVSLKFNDWATTSVFIALNLLGIVIEWFYLNHGAEIVIAYSASIIFTVGTLRLRHIVDIRRWFTLAESLNLFYALLVGSIFGSVYSLFNLIVLLVFWFKRLRERNTL
ncbi:MAG: YgjV family protein [Pseudomonadota bacterium]